METTNMNRYQEVSRTPRGFGGTRFSKVLVLGGAILFLFTTVGENAFARGGFRGGGSRSSSSFRSSSSRARSLGTSTSRTGWGSATKSTTSSKTIGGTRVSASSVKSQRTVYNAARKNGTVYSSRDSATQAFRAKYASQYTSNFASEPSSRPDYIPRATTVSGKTVNVSYNLNLGGYGYMHPTLGRWMLYDAMADSLMMDTLMARHYYWWGGAPVYVSHGGGFFSFALTLLILFIIISLVLRGLRSNRSGW